MSELLQNSLLDSNGNAASSSNCKQCLNVDIGLGWECHDTILRSSENEPHIGRSMDAV